MHSLAAHALPATRSDWRAGTHEEAETAGRYRFLLLFRYLLINGTGLVLLGAIWMQGWVDRILAADDTHICKLIFALFVVGVVWTGQQVLMLSRELNALERWPAGPDCRTTEVLRAMRGRDGHTRSALVAALDSSSPSALAACATWPAPWCCWA